MNQQGPTTKDIFLAALDCSSSDELEALLAGACRDDAALRRRVNDLLTARRDAGSFLGGGWTAESAETESLDEAAGTVIGPYRLEQQIGEGGFGVVFLAQQEAPVRRRVALKIIKPGMDTRQVIARFEAERQALAMMDHSNIAKVYDAGSTETGRPYFVMELVHGAPITEFCDKCNLTTRDRLELFVSVCRAVQHAHQKGVIHRDIKPTNVLVAIEDGEPTPKIIDFGVAKALDQQLTDRTQVTAFAQVIGTPLYMSPEQAELSQLGVDTRSDIYSLGVLLYELLTGTTPFERERIRAASYDELRRILRDEEPPRPSQRLSTLALDRATTIAETHRTESRRLIQAVRGDLDWIVMKCLEKDRARRYETADGLARDVEHYLADEPVSACPPSAAYRFRKFAVRNRAALAGGAAVLATLLLAVVGLAVSNRLIATERNRAEQQRQYAEQMAAEQQQARLEAQAEAAKSQEVVNLLQDMLAAAHPDSTVGKNFTVRELLDQFSTGLGARLDDQPEVEATLQQVIGSVYTRLGLTEQAEPHLRRALELHRELSGEQSVNSADSERLLAWNLLERDRSDRDVERLVRHALAVYRDVDDVDRILQAEWLLVLGLDGQGRSVEAKSEALVALEFARDRGADDHPSVPNLLHHLAWIEIRARNYPEAERLARKSVARHVQIQGEEHPETGFGWMYLGASLHRQGKYAETETCYRKALEIFRRSFPEDHAYIRPTLVDLAAVLRAVGKTEALVELWDDAIARWPNDAEAHNDLSWALSTCEETQLRRPDMALELAERAVAIDPENGLFWNSLGVARYRAGKWNESIDAFDNSMKLRSGGDANDWYFLAMAEWQLGNRAVARDWFNKADAWRRASASSNKELARFHDEAAELIGQEQDLPKEVNSGSADS